MPRCCQGGTCACLIQASDFIDITGVGSAQDPYVIGADLDLEVVDNSTFNLSLGGSGSTASPWVLGVSFASTASVNDFPDVDTSAKANGKGLIYNSSTQHWEAQTVPTAAPGAVSSDTSIDGDGSVGAPLAVAHDPSGYTTTGTGGIGLTATGKNSLVRHFGNALARSADPLTPILNAVTVLDDSPGVQWYWTGSQWKVVTNGVTKDFGTELLALSGPYVDGQPTVLVTRQISTMTDPTGQFDILTATDLSGAAGVLALTFQETGSVPYKAMVFANIDHVSAIAYRLDDGTPLASQPITGTVIGYTY